MDLKRREHAIFSTRRLQKAFKASVFGELAGSLRTDREHVKDVS
ncbi:hypothetical protein RESH_00582 [Rhodopirellula europaea SH398]|uniref:Uncharacterized protein n=1 Tax=Rhodopirellula europaea SH398 TaxID=1263868 RepID=M5SBG9_9BACT|nr:hypothetical protein RESH_00582 [Rhodopirellula europaea SH398]